MGVIRCFVRFVQKVIFMRMEKDIKTSTNTPEYASALFHATIKASVKGNPKPIPKGKKKAGKKTN